MQHPYDTPEVIASDIVGGSKAYLDWVANTTKRAEVEREHGLIEK